MPSYSLEHPGPRSAAVPWHTGKVEGSWSTRASQDPGKNAENPALGIPRLHFPASTTTSDQIFPMRPRSDSEITPRLWDGALELPPQGDPSWKTAQPEQNHRKKISPGCRSTHPTCWRHRAGLATGIQAHCAADSLFLPQFLQALLTHTLILLLKHIPKSFCC